MDNWMIYALINRNKGGESKVKSPALRLIDWEGTVLKEYSPTQVASLTELPEPSNLNTKVDRELLTFQGWNWLLTDIKSWVTAHEGECLTVGAIYTTTDGEDHTYWDDPIFGEDMRFAVLRKQGTETISINEFQYCGLLESVNVPYGVTSIGSNAFKNCASLKTVVLPDSITSIGNYAFYGCTSLENIVIPPSVITIGTNAFKNCPSLKTVVLPGSITSIGGIAFQNCTSLKAIRIPTGITSVSGALFYACESLERVDLPNTVINLLGSIFYYCESLKAITIPDSVTSIANNVFSQCVSLNAIVIKGKPELGNVNAISDIYADCLIYVPRENLSWFETATNWSTFYAQDKIVTIEDNIDFLRAIGIDV